MQLGTDDLFYFMVACFIAGERRCMSEFCHKLLAESKTLSTDDFN